MHIKFQISNLNKLNAQVEWNRLQLNVRSQQTILSFRSQLRPYLFRLAYSPPESSFPGGCFQGYDFARSKDCPFWDSSALEDLHHAGAIQMFL